MWSCCCSTRIRRAHSVVLAMPSHRGGTLVALSLWSCMLLTPSFVEVVCVVPPRTEIGNLCRLCAVVGILTAYRGLWLPPPGS